MAGYRIQGPLGKAIVDKPDSGTLCRQNSPTPGTLRKLASSLPTSSTSFRMWALAEAWTGAYLMEVHSLLSLLGTNPKSSLGGDMLRMYLRGRLDPEIISKIAVEITESKTFVGLTDLVVGHLRLKANVDFKSLPSAKQIESESRHFLKDWKKKHGIAFRGELNPVVGGITEIDVVGPVKVNNTATKESSSTIEFQFDLSISDRYDFSNTREGAYERFRQHLYELLATGEYSQFVADYHTEFYFGSLGKLRTFASFMYAIERFGLTPGALDWSIVLPMRGQVTYP